jgi:Acetyl xylan esterase (AXE1)
LNFRNSSIFLAFMRTSFAAIVAVTFLLSGTAQSAPDESTTRATPGDRQVAEYFKAQTDKISSGCLSDIHSLADWEARRPELRREAREMLGLDPMPPRTALHPVITGRIEERDFTVEKLYFQSSPHLYVTADLYLPKPLTNPAPTVLYLCGHTAVINNGVSYGNKTAYQHHGIWFARNGYVCLIIDTLENGEILGHHKGTYDEGAWWWNSRGYTPAVVETWDAIRALDYLESRPEVDTNRIGVTGRSGGGAYSWFLAAVDDRVRVVAPVAGIGDLESYCAEGTVDDHCDCMFFVNTYRWDYPLLAALCAPRPLLLADTDADEYFPLDGVLHTHDIVKRIYDLYGVSTNFGLVIAPGPHKDTQDVQIPVFRWFNIHLKHEDPKIDMAAVKMFSPEQLKVFTTLPPDQINTRIEYSFEPEAPKPEVPTTAEQWQGMKAKWVSGLLEKCFAGWPGDSPESTVRSLKSAKVNGIVYEKYEIQSQSGVSLPIYLIRKAGARPRRLILRIADASVTNGVWDADDPNPGTQQFSSAFSRFDGGDDASIDDIKSHDTAYAVFFPRGTGPMSWSGGPLRETQLRRRYMLIGQTLDGMRVWDICRAIEALHSMKSIGRAALTVEASGDTGVNALYASLFTPGISGLRLTHIPASQMDGPDYLNVLKILDIPEAAAMAAERCPLQLQSDETNGWGFLRAMADCPVAKVKVEWDNQ